MTSHLDEGRLQELLDGEVPSSALAPIQAHLALCAECRARLDEARELGAEADRLIETIDLADAPVRVTPRAPAVTRKPWVRNLAWAATVVFAAGIGYAARDTGESSPMQELARNRSVQAPAIASAPAAEPESGAAAPAPPRTNARPFRAGGAGADQPARERPKETAADLASGQAVEKDKLEKAAAAAGELRRLAASADSDSARKKVRGALGDTQFRLEEVVVTGATEGKAAAPPPAQAPPGKKAGTLSLSRDSSRANLNRLDEIVASSVAPGARAKAAAPALELTLSAARARLGGTLRQIEGLALLRVEALGDSIRAVYPLASGELHLVEWLHNGELLYRLRAPAGFPADSLDRLRARVRE
jgi:hypothetical protein